MTWYKNLSKKTYIIIFVGILVAQALTLFSMGRTPLCQCGYVKVWQGDVMSAENSQHIADWYTFSHIIHGFIFYGLMYWVSRKFFGKSGGLPVGMWLLGAVLLEVGWEIIENSTWVIEYYRNNTVSLGYVGDSILNSVFDVIWMSIGFLVARKLPVCATVALAVLFEVMTGYFVRDGLALNILFFIYPSEAIKAWQTAL
jgi:hypothetical protein